MFRQQKKALVRNKAKQLMAKVKVKKGPVQQFTLDCLVPFLCLELGQLEFDSVAFLAKCHVEFQFHWHRTSLVRCRFLQCAIPLAGSMAILPPAQLLSWSSARLLALLLNALTGFFQHLEKDKNVTIGIRRGKMVADWDTILGLRLIQDSLLTIDQQLQDRGFHPVIFDIIRNLTFHSDVLLKERIEKTRNKDSPLFDKLAPLFMARAQTELANHKLVDGSLRWADKNRNNERETWEDGGMRTEGQNWIREETQGVSCLLFSMHPKCEISSKCTEYLTAKGKIGTVLTEQMFFLQLVHEQSISKCPRPLTTDNSSFNFAFENDGVHRNSTNFLISEICANMFDELNAWTTQKNRKKLARTNADQITLLTEQTFLCGQNGFVQFVSPQLLVTLLSWQHPKLGCWTAQKPDLMNNVGIRNAIEFERIKGMLKERTDAENESVAAEISTSREQDYCLGHMSIVAAMTISSVYLRLLLDPGPWPEHSLAEQMVQMDGVPAEDEFWQFPYLRWVHDSSISGRGSAGFQLLRPPSSNWSPDLIAFVVLLFFILFFFILFVHMLGKGGEHYSVNKRTAAMHKKMYPYAFKKL